jgi:hypothetical protein
VDKYYRDVEKYDEKWVILFIQRHFFVFDWWTTSPLLAS